MSSIRLGLALIAAVSLSACAQKADQISATYVSPVPFEKFSCRQIREEAARVSTRASEVAGIQNKKAENDATATAVSLILFWPAAFFIKGDAETAAELGRLKGELQALEQVSIKKGCNITFVKETPADEDEKDTKKSEG
ncbi:MAG: hypothetical protein HRU30_01895 [Rhodobacteraceae bacterium]|nr:hypothetical protein [Paracoccaceae bacterium]